MNRLNNPDLGKLILRVLIGGLMLFHGVSKLFHGVDFIQQMLGGLGLPGFIAYGVYVGEVLAPILIIIGYRTRMSAFIVALTMVFAVALAHSGDLFKLTQHGGLLLELQWFYFAGSIALMFLGAGKYSVSKGAAPCD
ncbi:DoxX family protein [Prolixibacteraceae bacterium JC049]|nr:DoxX family protein [Prolixibacteraceae bacterium JC049]